MGTKAPNPVDKHVGSRVRMRRIMLGMSQEKLADRSARPRRRRSPGPAGYERSAASVPGTSQAKGTAPAPAYVTDFLATRDGLALIKAFMRIKESRRRRRIVALVEDLADEE